MANWAITNYVIEGPQETLQRIYDAILHHKVVRNSDEHWEGNVLEELGITYLSRDDDRENGYYMRGFINEEPTLDGELSFVAEEAWGPTDFYQVLEENIPDIKVYWSSEEPMMEVFLTNDKERKYFIDRYYVTACINDDYLDEYFTTEESAWNYVKEISDGKITNREELDAYNEQDNGDDYIYLNEFKVV